MEKENIEIGSLVKFPSIYIPYVGYGIYLGEEAISDPQRPKTASRIKFLYVSNPYADSIDLNCEEWHREFQELELCSTEDKTMLSIQILLGNKKPER